MILAHRHTAPSPDRRRAQMVCVPELVAAQRRAHPHATALAFESGTMSYQDLDAQANRLAGRLRGLGVGTDVPVGLCVPRSAEMVVGALAILQAGGAYVPMDPAYPSDRLRFILEDTRAPVVLTNRELAARLPVVRSRILCVEELGGDTSATAGRLATIRPTDLAYIIYTSGSTGRPKGVEITHGGLANLVSWHVAEFAVTAADRASHLAGLGFDAAVWELWPYLAAGASVHVVDEDTRNSADALRDWLLARGITIGFVPTPLLEQLLDLPWPSAADLRILLTGGDALHRYPPPGLPFQLVNNYGPTECTVVTTSGPVVSDETVTAAPPIGRAIANVKVYLLDDHRRPVAEGEPGEIYIGGMGLARGYHNRRALTASKFVPDPFDAAPASRLYRTGDLGRELPDGRIAFLGRIDDQVKIRGYRIEPGEVSATLNRHPAVRGSLVLAREDSPGDKRLVAYVSLAEDAEATRAQLREFLGGLLPDYMLPSAFVRMDAFPMTSHGKIDRTLLPAPDTTNTLRDDVMREQLSSTEEYVADLLCELLKLQEIALDDNFFMLGGHSLLGAQVIARIHDAYGVDITLRTLFLAPSVASLSAEVDRRVEQGNAARGDTPDAGASLSTVGTVR